MICACALLSSVVSGSVVFFRIRSSHKRHDFRNTLLNIKCVFWLVLQRLSKHFSFYEEESAIRSDVYIGLNVMYSLFLCDFNET